MATMQAVIVKAFAQVGTFADAFELATVPRPEAAALRKGEVLVRVASTTVNIDDIHVGQGSFGGGIGMLQVKAPTEDKPLICGSDFAGVVQAVGPSVSLVKVGDRVCGMNFLPMKHQQGAFAEFVVAPQENCHLYPAESLSFAEAAAMVMPTFVASAMLKEAALPKVDKEGGQAPKQVRCLVIGASGGIGSTLVQLLRAEGEHVHIVGVCSSKNEAMVKKCGCNQVCDYTEGPWAEQLTTPADAAKFDVVFDLLGGAESYEDACKVLAPKKGRFVTAVGPVQWLGSHILSTKEVFGVLGHVIWKFVANMLPGQHPTYAFAVPSDLTKESIEACVKAGVRPAIDRQVAFRDEGKLREAVRHVASHRAQGKVVVTVWDGRE